MAFQDVRFYQVTDGRTIEEIEKAARCQGVTPDQLVQAVLENCVELDLLKNVVRSAATDPFEWGER